MSLASSLADVGRLLHLSKLRHTWANDPSALDEASKRGLARAAAGGLVMASTMTSAVVQSAPLAAFFVLSGRRLLMLWRIPMSIINRWTAAIAIPCTSQRIGSQRQMHSGR